MSEETLVVRARGLQKDLTEFEQTLPERSASSKEAWEGLLGMKHLLFEQFKARARNQNNDLEKQTWHSFLSKKWRGYWDFWDDGGYTCANIVLLGEGGGGTVLAGISLAIQVIFRVTFLSAWISAMALWSTLLLGGFPLVASALSYFTQGARLKRKEKTRRAELQAQLEEERVKLNEDPVFLITSVQEYVGEAVRAFHSHLSEIKAAFERAAIHPRLEADELLNKLRGKRGVVEDMADERLPDKAVILHEIDKHIRECEAILENKHPEEKRITTLLEEVQARIWALHEYPKRLETLRQALLSQASLLKELRGIGVHIQELQGRRGAAIQTLVSELRDLRTDIGVALVTMSQFQTYLEQDPRIGELSSRASSTEPTSARALAE